MMQDHAAPLLSKIRLFGPPQHRLEAFALVVYWWPLFKHSGPWWKVLERTTMKNEAQARRSCFALWTVYCAAWKICWSTSISSPTFMSEW
jgi:hypothetical protein